MGVAFLWLRKDWRIVSVDVTFKNAFDGVRCCNVCCRCTDKPRVNTFIFRIVFKPTSQWLDFCEYSIILRFLVASLTRWYYLCSCTTILMWNASQWDPKIIPKTITPRVERSHIPKWVKHIVQISKLKAGLSDDRRLTEGWREQIASI